VNMVKIKCRRNSILLQGFLSGAGDVRFSSSAQSPGKLLRFTIFRSTSLMSSSLAVSIMLSDKAGRRPNGRWDMARWRAEVQVGAENPQMYR